MISETPRLLQKLSLSCARLYIETKVFNDRTTQIQREIVSEMVNIRRICPFQVTSG
jgi:hypothetical protein